MKQNNINKQETLKDNKSYLHELKLSNNRGCLAILHSATQSSYNGFDLGKKQIFKNVKEIILLCYILYPTCRRGYQCSTMYI